MLPEDLLIEILVRVPVKYLLRCKSVCKPWLSLISSPNFMNSQIRRAVTKPGADETLVVHQIDDHSISLLHVDSSQIGAPLGLPFSRGDFSFEPDFDIVGSYNGVVCVSVSNSPWDDKNPNIYIWNPATKQSKLLPPHNIRSDIRSVALGFGFDPKGNDFKVVRIVCLRNMPRCSEVYSANMNVWRNLESGPSDYNEPSDYPEDDDFDVCVNGFLCCTGYYGMMAFDLDKEVFTCDIQFPERYDEARINRYYEPRITDFNDCIAFINYEQNQSNNMINLWTLDDEACLRDGGVEASWTLMLSIVVDRPVHYVYGYFNRGDLLLKSEHGVWLFYNSNKKEARNFPGSIVMRQIFKYNESLVTITGSGQVD